jgi:hypothetical protein
MLARSFIFLLLAFDWAGDPELGQSLLSTAFRSQDVYCRSFTCRNEVIRDTCESVLATPAADIDMVPHSSAEWPDPPDRTLPTITCPAILYLFMTLLR